LKCYIQFVIVHGDCFTQRHKENKDRKGFTVPLIKIELIR